MVHTICETASVGPVRLGSGYNNQDVAEFLWKKNSDRGREH